MNRIAVNCPTCGKPTSVNPKNPWRPFCCERCKLIDLGEWANERHRIPGEKESSGLPTDTDDLN